MRVKLTKQLRDFVNRRVASGDYASKSEVVREALRILVGMDREREERLKDLRAQVAIGLAEADQGKARYSTARQMKRRLKQRLKGAKRRTKT